MPNEFDQCFRKYMLCMYRNCFGWQRFLLADWWRVLFFIPVKYKSAYRNFEQLRKFCEAESIRYKFIDPLKK